MRNTRISDIVKIMDINKLKPYSKNPRKNERAIGPVANSISQFGFKVPIIVDKDNVIIAGHTRLLAAKELGITEVPVIVADDLTPEQVKAYRLADNKTGELAGWDFELLDLELEELGDVADLDMGDFGFKDPAQGEDISPDNFGTDFELSNENEREYFEMSFKLHSNQKDLITWALESVDMTNIETFENPNKNGNALYAVVKEWAELKKLR